MANARWELVGQGQGVRTVAAATRDGDVVRVVLGSETTTFSGSLEEAVRQTSQLRALAPGMEWSLTTDLDDWTAVTLLGRPPEEVEGITINGAEWETASDDRGPFLRPEELFDDERFLTVLMKFGPDDDYDQAWCFDRAGPLCQLWTYAWSESGEEDHVIYEPDDVAAVERFADLLEGESVAQVTGDLVERLGAAGRGQLMAALRSSGLNWHLAWWFGKELWLPDGPAPILRVAELNLADAFLRLDDDVLRVGHELDGADEWAGSRRVVLVPAEYGTLDLLVNAAFTAGDANVDAAFAVQLDFETGGTWAGVEIENEALHLRLAAAFGALALVVTDSQLIELGADQTRPWELMLTKDHPVQLRLEPSVPWR